MELRELDLHDARLCGIVSLTGSRVLLLFVVEGGARHSVLLSGVESLRADDFTFDNNGNIVLDLEMSTGEDCTREDVGRAMLRATETTKPEPYVDTMLERIRRGELRLLRMDPSYGCSFWCIYEEAVVDPPARL